MNDFYIQMAISTVIAFLTHLIPADGSSKKKWKKAMLKVFNTISAAYKDDADFQTMTTESKPLERV